MCAFPSTSKSGITVAPAQQSTVSTQTLNDPDVMRTIQLFKDLVVSCYGPAGRIKIIQNSSGGHVTLTTLSSTLFQCLSISSPVLQFLKAAVQSQVSRCSDGGLYTAMLAVSLVEKCLLSEIPRKSSVRINEFMLQQTLEFLESPECPCKLKIDFSDSKALLRVVSGVVGSKPACCLLPKEKSLVSSLVLQSFLQSVTDSAKGRGLASIGIVQYVKIEGRPTSESYLVPGVLFEAPHLPTYRSCVSKLRRVDGGPNQGLLRVALYNVSMSGDSDEFMNVQYESTGSATSSSVVLTKILQAVEDLVQRGVGLVACQRVIHPTVKKYLRERHVLTVDRLSLSHINAVQQLTGANLLSTFHSQVSESDFGYLSDVTHEVLFEKSFLHMQSSTSNVVTVILCNHNESSVDELKNVCENAHVVLRNILVNPIVLKGSGTMEQELVSHLRRRINKVSRSQLDSLNINRSHFLIGADMFVRCLEEIVRRLPEITNPVTEDIPNDIESTDSEADTVLDSFSVKTNALRIAVEVANTLLQINNFINDQN